MTNTAEVAKINMIKQQMRPWEVLDSQVLAVINEIDRHDFVEDRYRGLAYADCAIPISEGASMLPPTIEGRLLQALLITEDDKILEIGSGCGYITACLAKLGKQVHSIDINAEALIRAKKNTDAYSLENIEYEQANAFDCEFDQAFDVIAVGASVGQVPENLKLALAIGGRMFVITGHSPVMQALLITRTSISGWTTQSLFETDVPALVR
ncbi:MAG: protein-L-isoaspartate O-methyltransferase [Gammaproteobacteria bacterium]|nr:protein-L-isoaspartate O-methyltransferase [Gammaproteobacteria bacterium]